MTDIGSPANFVSIDEDDLITGNLEDEDIVEE